jgi:hypothetical protein
MISNVNFSLFPSDELLTVTNESLAIVEPQKNINLAVTPFWEKAKTIRTLYQGAMERELKNPYTKAVSEKDQVRSESFMAFRTYVEACSHRRIPDWKEASNKILDVFRHYGWNVATMGYRAETATIINIISDLKNKYTAELALISGQDWMDELDTTEKEFDAIRNESLTNLPVDGPTVWEVRPQLVASLKAMFSMISLLNSSAPNEDLTAVENSLKELISTTLSSVKASRTRIKNAKNGNGKNGMNGKNGKNGTNGQTGTEP